MLLAIEQMNVFGGIQLLWKRLRSIYWTLSHIINSVTNALEARMKSHWREDGDEDEVQFVLPSIMLMYRHRTGRGQGKVDESGPR